MGLYTFNFNYKESFTAFCHDNTGTSDLSCSGRLFDATPETIEEIYDGRLRGGDNMKTLGILHV